MNDVTQLQKLLDGKSTVTARVGVFVGTEAGQALVDMGGERFPTQMVGSYVPAVNDPVHVWSIDGAWFLVGSSRAKPTVGTVLTVSSPNVTVDTSQGVVPAVIGGTAPTSGQRVVLHWTEDGPVTGVILASTPATPEVPATPVTPPSAVREVVFRPIDAGSTDRVSARWWQAQPWASNTTYGAWFYGSQIKDTIPSGAVFVSLEFYVNRVQDSGGAPRFALHSSPTKAGVPSVTAYAEWDPPNGWGIPPGASAWFDALKAGGAQYGVALNQGGFNKFASLAQDGMSGALRIRWR